MSTDFDYMVEKIQDVSSTFMGVSNLGLRPEESALIAEAVFSELSSIVRDHLEAELKAEGATRDDTMAVRGFLKTKGLWDGPDTWRG